MLRVHPNINGRLRVTRTPWGGFINDYNYTTPGRGITVMVENVGNGRDTGILVHSGFAVS